MITEIVVIALCLVASGFVAWLYGIAAHVNIILFPQIAQLTFTQAIFSRYFLTWCWTQNPIVIYVIVTICLPIAVIIKVALKDDD